MPATACSPLRTKPTHSNGGPGKPGPFRFLSPLVSGYMPGMSEDKKGSFFERLKKTVDQAWAASDQAPARAPLPGARAGQPANATGPIPPRAATPPAPRTDQLQRSPATAQLGPKATAPLPEDAQKALTASDHELSPKRLAMIDDFMTGKAKIAQMKDPTFMYKVVSDERAYQTQLLFELQEQQYLLGTDVGPEAEALQAQINRSQAIVTNLFKVLKYITGKKGRTGGTGFLSEEK